MPERQPLKPRPIPAAFKGSTIDQDGIRITGTMDYIEQVLSHLKPMLRFEAGDTRLSISLSIIADRETNVRKAGRFRCYVQVHQRGGLQ